MAANEDVNSPFLGKVVQFPEYDEAGNDIMLTGVVESDFTDPDDYEHYRPSFRVRTAEGKCYTPYQDECYSADS